MNIGISGMGWVTPLGSGLLEVLGALHAGTPAESRQFTNPETGRIYPYMPVSPKLVDFLGRNPRLRRSSTISYLAVAAGVAAIENAGLAVTPAIAARTAVVFGISDGGVQYTRRFFEQIVKQGANVASPMLFPETVYNAPASHLAAQLGLNGASYTLVGDASVGLAALHFGTQLFDTHDIDQCVVVGAEEADWMLCEGYNRWRLGRTPLAEGAAAVLLTRSGRFALQSHPGYPFFAQSQAAAALRRVLGELPDAGRADLLVQSDGGTFAGRAESIVLEAGWAGIRSMRPKTQMGEAVGASALMQVIIAALELYKQRATHALVTVVGASHQASGAALKLNVEG